MFACKKTAYKVNIKFFNCANAQRFFCASRAFYFMIVCGLQFLCLTL